MIYRKLEMDERKYSGMTKDIYGSIPYTEEKREFDDADNSVQQAAVVNNFIQAVAGCGEILCPPEEAAKSVELINAAYLSSWQKRAVSFPLDTKLYREEWERHCREE